jgi:hypothetical protein
MTLLNAVRFLLCRHTSLKQAHPLHEVLKGEAHNINAPHADEFSCSDITVVGFKEMRYIIGRRWDIVKQAELNAV